MILLLTIMIIDTIFFIRLLNRIKNKQYRNTIGVSNLLNSD